MDETETLQDSFRQNKMCRSCLASDRKMHNLCEDQDQLLYFAQFSDLELYGDVPSWICWQCLALLRRCIQFRSMCQESFSLLANTPAHSAAYIGKIRKQMTTCRDLKPEVFPCRCDDPIWEVKQFMDENDAFVKEEVTDAKESLRTLPCSGYGELSPGTKTEIDFDFDHYGGSDDEQFTEECQEPKVNSCQEKEKATDEKELLRTFVSTGNRELYPKMKIEMADYQSDGSDNEPIASRLKKLRAKSHKKIDEDVNWTGDGVKRKIKMERTRGPLESFELSSIKKTVYTEEQQYEHLRKAREQEDYISSPFKCEGCAKGFRHKIAYTEHLLKHNPVSGELVCKFCTQRFHNARGFDRHRRSHSLHYSCRLCAKSFSTEYTARLHVRNIHSDSERKEVQCDLCKKILRNKYTLIQHLETHNKSKKYICDQCPKAYASKAGLVKHILVRHRTERPFSCDGCDKTYAHQADLASHQLIHGKGVRLFYCVECDKSYGSRKKLLIHYTNALKHRKPEPYRFACSQCDKRYFAKIELVVHIKQVHQNLRQFRCPLCPSAFNHKGGLRLHTKRVHLGQRAAKSFVCQTCGMAFRERTFLNDHMRRHTGERPYVCKYCADCFGYRSVLNTHIRLVHLKKKAKPQRKRAVPPETETQENLHLINQGDQ